MTGKDSAPPSAIEAEDKEKRIATLRARYDALRAEGQSPGKFESSVAGVPRLPRAIADRLIEHQTSIPPGWYWHGRLSAGTCLRLDNRHGTLGVACLLWNAADSSERLCVTDTIKVQWTTALSRGRLLLSDMGRVLAAIVEDTCGHHDVLTGAGFPRMDESSSPLSGRNGHENLILAATKLGLDVRDLHAPVTFFAPVRCISGRHFAWDAGTALDGSYVDLHAEMDLLIAISNTPHPMAPPTSSPQEIGLAVWRPEQPDVSGFCREATDEAMRAYDRTRAYLARHGGNADGRNG